MHRAEEQLDKKMSKQDNAYTELTNYSNLPANVYDASEQDIGTNSNAMGGSKPKPRTCSGKSGKLLVAATIINFVLIIIIGATGAYLLHTQAGRLSETLDSSMLQGSGAAAGTTGPQGPPGPPGAPGDVLIGPPGIYYLHNNALYRRRPCVCM